MPWDILTYQGDEGHPHHPHLSAHSLVLTSPRQQLFLQPPPNSAFVLQLQARLHA